MREFLRFGVDAPGTVPAEREADAIDGNGCARYRQAAYVVDYQFVRQSQHDENEP
jgi:hypothetical protein